MGNNRLLTVVLVALASVAGGLAIVFSVGIAMQVAMMPVSGYLREIVDGQKRAEKALMKSAPADGKVLEARISALEAEVAKIKTKEGRLALPEPPDEDMNRIYDIPVGDSAVLGPKDARITITVFADYQCPFCGRFYPAAAEAQKAFADKVRIVVKHFPLVFHHMARPAAKAALAAGEQGKFYEMSDLLLANAATLGDDKFKEIAGKVGLNVEMFVKSLKEKDALYEQKINADFALGGKSDVRGTPVFFLNGKKTNARTVEAWKAEIEALLKK